eukprot:TCALIF_11793-PA protein Name:"Protein of unknown function" AED:0.11 eAED:0.11 QI:279/0.5/0.66/1/1/1/3/117/158
MGVTASRTLSVAGPTDLNDITFRIVDQSRYPEVLELLYANFHPDEPMSRALNIYSGDHRVPAIDEYTLNGLKENLSLMAVDSFTNKLLGIYSRKASERLGFTMTAEFFYDEYIAADGTTGIFSDMGNHKCATLLVKRLLVNQDSIEENEPVRNESDHA